MFILVKFALCSRMDLGIVYLFLMKVHRPGTVKKAFRKDQLRLKNFWIYLAFLYFYPLVCHLNLKIFRFFHFY